MDEREANTESKEVHIKKTSTFARLSLYCSAFAWLVIITTMIEIFFDESLYSWIPEYVLTGIAFLFHILIILALLFLVVSIIHIILKRKTVKGWIHIIGSFLLVLPFVSFPVFMSYINYMKSPPIHSAAGSGDIVKVKSLLSKKPELVNSKSIYPDTPLHRASAGGHTEIVKILIAYGAEVNVKDGWQQTPLTEAIVSRCHKDVIEVLLENGADVNAKVGRGDTPLIRAIDTFSFNDCSMETIELLILRGADVNVRNNRGETALSIASEEGLEGIVYVLREHGAVEHED